MPKGKQPHWQGVDLPLLKEVEQRLCRCKNRVLLFGGNEDRVIKHGHFAMLALLIHHVWRIVETDAPVAPEKQDVAKCAKVKPGDIGRILEGHFPCKKLRSPDRIARILDYLLVGPEPLSDDHAKTAKRIKDYFFRPSSAGDHTPAFFKYNRINSGDPFTPTELAGEVLWLARQCAATKAPSRLILVSGGLPFPMEVDTGPETNPKSAVLEALAAGVRVTAVYCDRTDSAKRSLEGIASSEVDRIVVPDGMDLQKSGKWRDFLSPHLVYFFLETTLQGNLEQSLFFMRPKDHESRQLTPFASEGNAEERRIFGEWAKLVAPSSRKDT